MLSLSLAIALLAAAPQVAPQNVDDPDYKLNVDVELVLLPVTVEDNHGLPVRDLQQEHFAIYEDKVPQKISIFKQEDIPLSVGLVIDASLSMNDKRDRLRAAAMTFVRESNPDDETAVLSFGTEVVVEHDFTADTQELTNTLSSIPSQESTAFYDAVYLAAKYIHVNASRDKKVLLVITDGEDNSSKYALREALKAVGEYKVVVYTIGLLSSGYSSSDEQTKAQKALKQLAQVTGGASFFPASVDEVQGICSRIARDLRNQYTIGYRPSNKKLDGSWRKVVVQLNSVPNVKRLRVRTKQGYYAPTTKRDQSAQIQ